MIIITADYYAAVGLRGQPYNTTAASAVLYTKYFVGLVFCNLVQFFCREGHEQVLYRGRLPQWKQEKISIIIIIIVVCP